MNQNRTQGKGKMPRMISVIIMLLVLAFGGNGVYQQQTQKDVTESYEAADTTARAESVQSKNDAKKYKNTEEEKQDLSAENETEEVTYRFRNHKLLKQHYEKHGIEMGFDSEEAYELAASAVVNNKNALHKTEKEDGDDIYYVEDTNEFVVVSTDGYLRTYFNPSKGIAYYNRQ
ncbi:MAG: hypothetical protein Q4B26_07540 [Eubacteriales bacterium]|nr:hypothetical protein [Eubacteriales bacterium]